MTTAAMITPSTPHTITATPVSTSSILPTLTFTTTSPSFTQVPSTVATTISPPVPIVIAVFPAAGVVAIVIAVFLLAVLSLLLLRKCVMARGGRCPGTCPAVCLIGGKESCWECCRGACERIDCDTPDCSAWLDRVCPTKHQCSLFCGQLVSCYSCHICVDWCRDVKCCPDCSAIDCPDCDCCNCCHCAIKAPECSHISCLCFECGRPPDV